MVKMTVVTMAVITVMLLLVYRSVSTVLLIPPSSGSRWDPRAAWSPFSAISG